MYKDSNASIARQPNLSTLGGAPGAVALPSFSGARARGAPRHGEVLRAGARAGLRGQQPRLARGVQGPREGDFTF